MGELISCGTLLMSTVAVNITDSTTLQSSHQDRCDHDVQTRSEVVDASDCLQSTSGLHGLYVFAAFMACKAFTSSLPSWPSWLPSSSSPSWPSSLPSSSPC